MIIEKRMIIFELKGAINLALLSASLASQKVGRLTATGELKEFFEAQEEERKQINKVEDLVDEIVKEAINEDNK